MDESASGIRSSRSRACTIKTNCLNDSPSGSVFISISILRGKSKPGGISKETARIGVGRCLRRRSDTRWPYRHPVLPPIRNYCTEFETSAGGGLAAKGSCAFERALCRWRTMRSITRGSVIKETMRLRRPQAHRSGSASKIFLINRTHVLRASLEQSGSSCFGCCAAARPAVSPSGAGTGIRPRLEYAP
jgi:hypothetical protein